jgi:hypothetical protein
MFKKPDLPGFRKKKSASASHTKKTAFIKNEGLSLLDDIDEETDVNGDEKPVAAGELCTRRKVLKGGLSPDHRNRFYLVDAEAITAPLISHDAAIEAEEGSLPQYGVFGQVLQTK